MSMRVNSDGLAEFFSIGLIIPGLHFITGNGTKAGISGGLTINFGTTIEQVFAFYGTITWGGGGTIGAVSYAEFNFNTTGLPTPTVRPTRDHVSVSMMPPSCKWISWSYVNRSISLLCESRSSMFNVTRPLLFLVTKLQREAVATGYFNSKVR
jgi:hypothetical protein